MTAWIAAVSTLALLWIAQAPPPTEVFLANLAKQDGRLTVGKPENISNSPGYDNQPFFTTDGGALLFTSARGSRQELVRLSANRHLPLRHEDAVPWPR